MKELGRGLGMVGGRGQDHRDPQWMEPIILSTQRRVANTITQYGSSLRCLLRGDRAEHRRRVRGKQHCSKKKKRKEKKRETRAAGEQR